MTHGLFPATVAGRYPHGYAVVDVETSGLRAASDRVLQVAVAQMAPDGRLENAWATLLDPGCDPGPTYIHGLTRQGLAGSPQYASVASRARPRGDDFVFFNAPRRSTGAADLTLDVPDEVLVNVRPGQVPARTSRVLAALAVRHGVDIDES